MTALDQQSPEQHRARYEALRAQAHAKARAPQPPRPCAPLAPGQARRSEAIPGGWYWSARIPRGRCLRIAGPSSVAALLWNAHDPSERFSAADTAKVQWTVRIEAGRLLLSDMGRVLASVVADSVGRHDLLAGGSTTASNARRYGRDGLRNTRDNFLLAAGKHGLDRRDVSPCITFFADVRTGADGRLAWHGGPPADAAIDLRAEMDLLVALSNCPHPLDPAAPYAPGPVVATLHDPAPPGPDDPCRTASVEARRAFENNAALHDA